MLSVSHFYGYELGSGRLVTWQSLTQQILVVGGRVDGPRAFQGHLECQHHLYGLVLFENLPMQSDMRPHWIVCTLNKCFAITDTGQKWIDIQFKTQTSKAATLNERLLRHTYLMSTES